MKKDEIKRFDMTKKPKVNKFIYYVGYLALVPIFKLTRKIKINRTNMEGLKPPYLVLQNHTSMVDFRVYVMVNKPIHKVNNVMSVETVATFNEFITRSIGVVPKRRYTNDLQLLKNMKYSTNKLGNVFNLFPESKFTLDGCNSYFQVDTQAKLIKFLKVPVVVVITHGGHISKPQWNKKLKNIPLEIDVTQIITKEEVTKLSLEEIEKRIKETFVYDDYKYQKEKGIKIKYKNRANNLNKILYKCPVCGKEHQMEGKGIYLTCHNCNAKWEFLENGDLKCLNHEDTFTTIKQWFDYEREEVRKEIINGTYEIKCECEVKTLPGSKGFIDQGMGEFISNTNGTHIKCHAYEEDVEIHKSPLELESIHIEFDYLKYKDVIDVSTLDESYYMYPINQKDIVTKVMLATEEMHKLALEKLEANKD